MFKDLIFKKENEGKNIVSSELEKPLLAPPVPYNGKNSYKTATEVYKTNMSLKTAIDILTSALRNDSDYYRSWKDNISVMFQDEFTREYGLSCYYDQNRTIIKKISDRAAEDFLKILMM